MLRFLLPALFLVLPFAAQAQQSGHGHDMVYHAPAATGPGGVPREPGQAAFAAIQEIVSILVTEPATDWTKVDVDALRRHLIDMDNVALRARVEATPLVDGVRYSVSGEGTVRESIRRMVKAHVETMSGVNGMAFEVEEAPDGAVMTVRVADAAALPRLRGLGLIGLMTLGMHHQKHHLMIASGSGPHE